MNKFKISTRVNVVLQTVLFLLLTHTSVVAQTPTPPYSIGDEIIFNGDFEAFELGAITANALNWSFNQTENGANASFEIITAGDLQDEKALQIDFGTFNNQPDLDWSVEAVNEPFQVQEGDIYEATFWAKADNDSRLAKYYFNLPASGNWLRYEQVLDTLTTEWKEYTIRHTANASDVSNTMRFSISLNLEDNDGSTIWIDNLSIKKVSEVQEGEAGNWGFEELEFGDWMALTDLPFNVSTTGEITDEQANTGNYSVKIESGNNASVGALVNDNYDIGALDTLRASVFLTAEDLAEVETVQLYFLHGGDWAFVSQDYENTNLAADEWNDLELVAPGGISVTQRIGVQFVGNDTAETSTMFIDDISVAEYVPGILEPEGTWSFENNVLGEWLPLVDLQFGNNTVGEVSDEQAFSGTYSAKIEVQNNASVGALINNNYSIGVFDTLSAQVFIPASELEEMEKVQVFFLHGGNWAFTSQDYESTNLAADTWNRLEVVAPEGIGSTQRIGVQFVGNDSTDVSFMYIDDIAVSEYVPAVFEPEGTWGFENEVFGEWQPLVDLAFDNNTSGVISTDQVRNGNFSARLQVADDASVGALVNDTYEVEPGDSLRAYMFIPDTELDDIDMVQIFLLHGPSFDFASTDYMSENLTANAWNKLELVIPEGVGNTQRIGVQFVDSTVSGTAFVYVDDLAVIAPSMSTNTDTNEQPVDFILSQNYPNPFNPSTNINYTISTNSEVKLEVFNTLGQNVATLVDTRQNAGSYTINFDASNLSSGIYFYRIQAGSFIDIKKMMLIK